MNNVAEVYLWGTRIGILSLKESRSYASFEYDRDFVKNVAGAGIELSPIMMPVSERVYEFPELANSFHGVPGMIADSLPDKFGNAVISRWLAGQGMTDADFNVIDRLCYTGKRGMGALEYVPATGSDADQDEVLNVSEMVRFASDILSGRETMRLEASSGLTYAGLLKLGTSAGGARAKTLIAWNEKTGEVRSEQIDAGDGFEYWLMKFDGVSKNGDHDLIDAPEYTLIEYAYYKMALACGIVMEECRLFSENGRNHFMTKRFDRKNGQKLHTQTLGALTHTDYNVPGLMGYEEASVYMRRLGLGADEIIQYFTRMVFNVLAVNQDDHVKNTSFLMDRAGRWSLSSAYDITFSYDENNQWLRAHQMTVNGKSVGIEPSDLREAGKNMGLTKRQIDSCIEKVRFSLSHWEEYASDAGIKENTYEAIGKKLGD